MSFPNFSDLPAKTLTVQSPFCQVGVDPTVGNLPLLAFAWQGRNIAPLHRAHWLNEADFPQDMPLVDRTLSGDFVCVPFGRSDVETAPLHGWSCNSPWDVVDRSEASLSLTLARPIMGARLTKHLRPASDSPLLYQVHTLEGGSGGITFAHHPMLKVTGGARLFTSPKQLAVTPDVPIVTGRHALANGATATGLEHLPGVDGRILDGTRLPLAQDCEDFVALLEAEGSMLGWSAVIREAWDDIVFVLKDPRVLPLTMLWHSNGGRHDAPWSGRHTDVLGIEDGIAAGGAGHRAALGQTVFSRAGVRTCLDLAPGRMHRIGHVIGAVGRPQGWAVIDSITIEADRLVLLEVSGQSLELPFDGGFFNRLV